MGILIALIVILLWLLHLIYLLFYFTIDFNSIWTYLHILLQTYLYTGLFITAHDAMHGLVAKNKILNKTIGTISTFLFASMSYKKLYDNHILHHKYPATEKDPDFYVKSNNFFLWWFNFLIKYVTIWQFISLMIIFNILAYFTKEINLILFWVIPPILSTFQLFYFGTYNPHKRPHIESMNPHNARSQKRNDLWAMLSCYFFGYHWEHHEYPNTPWWRLSKMRALRN